MNKPSFLLIGSMKCGTSTIFKELCSHPDVFEPELKEPADLIDDSVLTESGKRRYYKLYDDCGPDQICGDGSTHYTKYPKIAGVPNRAIEVLGADIKLIYIIDNVYKRIESHYAHEASNGKSMKGINEEIKEKSNDFINYSNYLTQIKQWEKVFPPENIIVCPFYEYKKDKIKFMKSIFKSLGIDDDIDINSNTIYRNQSTDRFAPKGMVRTLVQSDMYLRSIRRYIPCSIRQRIKKKLFKKSVTYRQELDSDSKTFIERKLHADVVTFCQKYGLNAYEII